MRSLVLFCSSDARWLIQEVSRFAFKNKEISLTSQKTFYSSHIKPVLITLHISPHSLPPHLYHTYPLTLFHPIFTTHIPSLYSTPSSPHIFPRHYQVYHRGNRIWYNLMYYLFSTFDNIGCGLKSEASSNSGKGEQMSMNLKKPYSRVTMLIHSYLLEL